MNYIVKNIQRELTKAEKRKAKLLDEVSKIDGYVAELKKLEKSHEDAKENSDAKK